MKANSRLHDLSTREEAPPVSKRRHLAQLRGRTFAWRHGWSGADEPVTSLQRIAQLVVRFRFGLRSFMISMTTVSLLMGLLTAQARRQEMTVAEIEGRGALVLFDTSTPGRARDSVGVRRWLARRLGHAWGARPAAVVFPPEMHVSDEDLRLVSRLGSVEVIHLDGYRSHLGFEASVAPRDAVTDRGLAYLERLPRLRQLTIRGIAGVTPTAVAEFRERRPACRVVDDPNERLTFFKL